MATKQAEKKIETRYVYAVGRRKTAVAEVRLFPLSEKEKDSDILVNGKLLKTYFTTTREEASALAPLKTIGAEGQFRATILARGGGKSGQADAVKLGIARALVKHDLGLRPLLKAAGFLSRDARAVERKKPGLKKARRAPQWSKR